MNINTGQVYPTMAEALADLKPHEKPSDVVEVIGDRETIEALSRTVQQMRSIEKRRAANKAARKSRQQNR
jgi:hypothetical protein